MGKIFTSILIVVVRVYVWMLTCFLNFVDSGIRTKSMASDLYFLIPFLLSTYVREPGLPV